MAIFQTLQTNIDAELQNGDYCKLSISHEGEVYNMMFLYYNNRGYLLSDDQEFDGAYPPLDRVEVGYRYGWTLPYAYSTIRECIAKEDDKGDLEIVSIDGTAISHTIEFVGFSNLIAQNYKSDNIYRGFHGYHTHEHSNLNTPKREYRGHRFGVELEVEFANNRRHREFTNLESNWFYCERDGSLGANGCEIVTIPLLPKDAKSIEFWKPLCDTIQPYAKSWDTGRCGLHVHIGREILGRDANEQSETLGKLLYFYHEFLKDTYGNRKIYGRDRGYHDNDGKTDVSKAVNLLGGKKLLKDKDIQKQLGDSMKQKSRESRYFDINCLNAKTIEFRKGRGSIKAERIAMVVEWSELIVKYVKTSSWQIISLEDFKTYLKFIKTKNQMLAEYIRDYFGVECNQQ